MRISNEYLAKLPIRVYSQQLHLAYRLREVFVGGEHSGLETLKWAQATFKKPVHEQWWQTGIGSICFAIFILY